MATRDPNLVGVGGWLAFFLVTLGIINPLVFIVTGYQALSDPHCRPLTVTSGQRCATLKSP